MNTFVIFAALAVTAVSAETFCVPGSFFKDDCNYCTCSEDGKYAGCTDMACPKTLSTTGQFCQPGKIFVLDDCNSCTCSRDGKTARCTLQFCTSKRNTITSKSSRFCTPGSVFSPDNCNKCICSKDGTKASCNLKMCETTNNKISKTKQVCKPFSHFNDYCNTCTCADDGLSFGCTYMWCDKNIWNKDGSRKDIPEMKKEKLTQKQVCQPFTTFKDYCNTCTCADDGLSFGCTYMWCDKNIWNKDGSRKDIPEFDEGELTQKKVCQPHSTFNDYCNTCACSDDGLSYACTRMICDKDIWNKDGSLKLMKVAAKSVERVCTPNTQFTEQCNTCICSNDGLSKMCTMITCNKDVEHEDDSYEIEAREIKSESQRVCTPGSVFSPDECNTCICSKDGTQLACTVKLCLTAFKQVFKQIEGKEIWGPVYNQGDSCTPGKLFFSECNQCICTKTGRSAVCTLMKCGTRS